MVGFTQFLFMICLLGLVHKAVTTEQCNGPRQFPILGKMLVGHTYETRWVRSGYAECLFVCREDKVCQSFNFLTKESVCEFNNRTQEAYPEDLVSNPDRLYVKLDVSRVTLGSIPELPAKSCQEIKANEGREMPSSKYWFSSLIPGKSVLAYCDMDTDDIDECSADTPLCNNGVCKNTNGSYYCSCNPGFTGNKTCSDIDECAGENLCDANANCTNSIGSYRCTCKTPQYYGNDGRNCKFARGLDKSTILSRTNLANLADARAKLNLYLDPVVQNSIHSEFVRCWHASKDGWSASVFHRNCDGKGPTVTIVKVNQFIFGGYSDISWLNLSSGAYSYSSKAFLFSLYNNYNYPYIHFNPVKLQIKSDSVSRQEAIYRSTSRGPTFGGGHDLFISYNARYNTNSYTYSEDYTTPPGCSPIGYCNFFAGSHSFSPTDVEVFYETTT